MKKVLLGLMVLTCIALISFESKADLIGASWSAGEIGDDLYTPIDVLLITAPSGEFVQGLAKSNFKLISARDDEGKKRAVLWTVNQTAEPGVYQLKIKPNGWKYYNWKNDNGDVQYITMLFKIAGKNKIDNGVLTFALSTPYTF